MDLKTLIWFVVMVTGLAGAEKKRYDGYQLLRVYVDTDVQRDFMRVISDDVDLDVWRDARGELDIFVPPTKTKLFADMLAREDLRTEVLVANMQELVEEEEVGLAERKKLGGQNYNYNDFNNLDAIFTELDALVARCPSPLTCESAVHGMSANGRQIRGIRIRRTDRVQKKIWIDATIHAREWLATATNMNIIRHLVDDYSSDAAVRNLVDQYDWYLLPVINSDGYAYTWSNERLWRKNRTPNAGSTCIGTDLNRNFADDQWGTSGTSANACSETFRGSGPGSEPETQAMQRAHDTLGNQMLLSVNLHTYGRMFLTPWSYENADGSCHIGIDHNDLLNAANAAADAIQVTYFTQWTRGPFCLILYAGSGTSLDYAKQKSGVKYTFLPELRGTNFIISAAEIPFAFNETWNGIKAAITAAEAAP